MTVGGSNSLKTYLEVAALFFTGISLLALLGLEMILHFLCHPLQRCTRRSPSLLESLLGRQMLEWINYYTGLENNNRQTYNQSWREWQALLGCEWWMGCDIRASRIWSEFWETNSIMKYGDKRIMKDLYEFKNIRIEVLGGRNYC